MNIRMVARRLPFFMRNKSIRKQSVLIYCRISKLCSRRILVKKILICTLIIALVIATALTLVACGRDSFYISFDGFIDAGNNTYTLKLANNVSTFQFTNMIRADEKTTWTVESVDGRVASAKVVSLQEGDNTFYVTAKSGNREERYTVVIRRRPIHTVTFNTDGGLSVAPKEVEEDNRIINEVVTSKRGYDFVGWDRNPSDPITEDITINAIWEPKTYTVRFNTSGGTPGHIDKIIQYNSEWSVDTPNKEGYTFIGWYFNNNGSFEKLDTNDVWSVVSDYQVINIDARYQPITYQIAYEELEGAYLPPENKTKYTVLDNNFFLINPTRTGYTFKGWSGTGLTGDENKSVLVTTNQMGNKVYTAHWLANRTYVSFCTGMQGAIGPDPNASIEINLGGEINFPVSTHTDPTKVFLGWFTNVGERITYADGAGITTWESPYDRVTLYDKWWTETEILRVDASNNPDPAGEYVLFGKYPQTVKASDVNILEHEGSLPPGVYYTGSDGSYYAKVIAYPFGDDYKFSDGTTIVKKQAYYFKVEPIKWRILNYSTLAADGNKARLLCEGVLDALRWNESYEGVKNGAYANNYEKSEIRVWLNNDFYDNTFNHFQKQLIQVTSVDNSPASTGTTPNIYACVNTNDKVFLPSIEETTKTSYGFNSDSLYLDPNRQKIASDYAKAKGIFIHISAGVNGDCHWFLRSPSDANSTKVNFYRWSGASLTDLVDIARIGTAPSLRVDLG